MNLQKCPWIGASWQDSHFMDYQNPYLEGETFSSCKLKVVSYNSSPTSWDEILPFPNTSSGIYFNQPETPISPLKWHHQHGYGPQKECNINYVLKPPHFLPTQTRSRKQKTHWRSIYYIALTSKPLGKALEFDASWKRHLWRDHIFFFLRKCRHLPWRDPCTSQRKIRHEKTIPVLLSLKWCLFNPWSFIVVYYNPYLNWVVCHHQQITKKTKI